MIAFSPSEAAFIRESVEWAVYHITHSRYNDPGKPERIAKAEELAASIRRKLRAAG